jgi:hypothetical protein
LSATESQWPSWLRRHTGVEFLGSPNLFFARLTIALSLGAILYVGLWNAAKYPISLGFDAQPNAAYIHILLDQHHIPRPDQSGEANQPPAYYLIAGVAARLGHKIFNWHETETYPGFPEASFRGALYLNVLLVFLTALCVLWLARVVAPGRPWVWAASLGFFAFLPVVSKTEAMLHPENLNMLTAAAAIASATTILVRRSRSRILLACLIGSTTLGLATRSSSVFVVLALALGAAEYARRAIARWPGARRWTVIGIVVLAVAGSIGLAYSKVHQHRIDPEATRAHFFDVSLPGIFETPWRSHFVNQAFTTTYDDIWGDWFGAFSWSVYDGEPSPAAQHILKDQSVIGVLPTVLAVAGWLGLMWMTFRRGRRELAVIALLPLVAAIGYLGRSWLALTRDGDLLKAAYLVNTAPVWALCFGLATAWLASRSRIARYGMLALFTIFAVLELRFTLYGIRDGRSIF